MLKKEDIIYPITFKSFGVGDFTFVNDKRGVFTSLSDGGTRDFEDHIENFIGKTNQHNPDNNPNRDYYYIIKGEPLKEEESNVCSVEDMPLCARLTGVEHEGEWINLSIQPVRIEVDGDTVTFLLHHTFHKGAFAGEVSIARGAKIRWEKA